MTSRLLAIREIKINLNYEESYKIATKILNENQILWNSCGNKLNRHIRVIGKGLSPSFGNDKILTDLQIRKYKILCVENII